MADAAVDIDPEWAAAWREAVEDVVRYKAPEVGGDAVRVLDSLEFIGTLDHLATTDPTSDGFTEAVESAVAEFVRTTEAVAGDDLDGDFIEDVRVVGRVMEAAGTGPGGGRRFRVRLIKYGDSKNGRRYSEAVMRAAAHLYEGAKAFDHHRTEGELRTSTIAGLAGQFHGVTAEPDGLYGTLTLLPGATHAAEALDASIAAQDAGRLPLVGLSHDVRATFRPISVGRRRIQEAVAIQAVQSTDLVADPSAGGVAVRAVAGGLDDDLEEIEVDTTESIESEDDVPTTESVLDALSQATPEQISALLAKAQAGTRTTEATPPGEPKDSTLGKLMISMRLTQAGITGDAATNVTGLLPERVTESDLDAAVAAFKTVQAAEERKTLAPTAVVVRESRDKVVEGLDKFFAHDYSTFRSFRQAYEAFNGVRPRRWDEDYNKQIFRESFGGYDSAAGERATESMDTTTWAQVLGDSVTRTMLAMYAMPQLTTWRQLVNIMPFNDFRVQRLTRFGGYGTLPTVTEGAPYQPLTSPGDEEATGTLAKKGGTEDVTLEMIANDDVRAISRIPGKLGRAAARTLYEAIFGILSANPTCTYDSVALFHSSHANTDTSSALSQTTLSVGRQKMRDQAAYGDTSEILGLQPKYLIGPNELEELMFELCTGPKAIGSTPASASDAPNINQAQGLQPLLVPSFTDSNDWFLSCDPLDCENIAVGFYQGREDPELFTQSDQSVGSMFDADRVTWKIRHIWQYVVTDHRGLYRGQG